MNEQDWDSKWAHSCDYGRDLGEEEYDYGKDSKEDGGSNASDTYDSDPTSTSTESISPDKFFVFTTAASENGIIVDSGCARYSVGSESWLIRSGIKFKKVSSSANFKFGAGGL